MRVLPTLETVISVSVISAAGATPTGFGGTFSGQLLSEYRFNLTGLTGVTNGALYTILGSSSGHIRGSAEF
jgi:hypothetical protein